MAENLGFFARLINPIRRLGTRLSLWTGHRPERGELLYDLEEARHFTAVVDGRRRRLTALQVRGMHLVCRYRDGQKGMVMVEQGQSDDPQAFRAAWHLLGGARQGLRWPDGTPVDRE